MRLIHELPTGTCDGSNTRFVLSAEPQGDVAVFMGGIPVAPANVSVNGRIVELAEAPFHGMTVTAVFLERS